MVHHPVATCLYKLQIGVVLWPFGLIILNFWCQSHEFVESFSASDFRWHFVLQLVSLISEVTWSLCKIPPKSRRMGADVLKFCNNNYMILSVWCHSRQLINSYISNWRRYALLCWIWFLVWPFNQNKMFLINRVAWYASAAVHVQCIFIWTEAQVTVVTWILFKSKSQCSSNKWRSTYGCIWQDSVMQHYDVLLQLAVPCLSFDVM